MLTAIIIIVVFAVAVMVTALGTLFNSRGNIDETQTPDNHKPETITFSPEDCE